jgi:hypothetical protein
MFRLNVACRLMRCNNWRDPFSRSRRVYAYSQISLAPAHATRGQPPALFVSATVCPLKKNMYIYIYIYIFVGIAASLSLQFYVNLEHIICRRLPPVTRALVKSSNFAALRCHRTYRTASLSTACCMACCILRNIGVASDGRRRRSNANFRVRTSKCEPSTGANSKPFLGSVSD